MRFTPLLGLAVLLLARSVAADEPKPRDLAAAFGARLSLTDLRLSPDGSSVSFIVPAAGQGSIAYSLSLAPGSKPKAILVGDGKPARLQACNWVSNSRLVCTVYALTPDPNVTAGLVPLTRVYAVNSDGSQRQLLSTELNQNTRGYLTEGGEVIDWLPDQDNAVLMTRQYLPDSHTGSHIGTESEGLGVDRVDTLSHAVTQVVQPRMHVDDYISDGRGTVRIRADEEMRADLSTGVVNYLYRKPGASAWLPLSSHNVLTHDGFRPLAVDPDLNVAYGFDKHEGRLALYSMSLDGSPREQLVFARPDVDVDGIIRIGRRGRVVGVSYSTDTPHAEFFSPEIRPLVAGLHRALPDQPLLGVMDASVDESKLVVFAGSDSDPGVYYIFDRKTHQLEPFVAVRGELVGMKLAHVKPISYPASDGVMIPGYLTLPAGMENPRGLPAIVLPHGGPSSRDEWGFDWMAQFFAARGYAVLQPNFRGSSGFGDAWFQKNGFQSWEIAVGDVLAGARWLVHEGIADPAKVGVVGWSYGGYAALQSTVLDPSVFKAIVAIAPVTDLDELKEERRNWSDFSVESDFIGSGPHMHAGSPIEHAKSFHVPVLLFHGTMDRNVSVQQSKRMCAALTSAGARCELVLYQDRDHNLEDSEDRADMLRKSEAFLRKAFGM